jgi:serine/threonine protein kinase, bacterial
MLLREGQRFAGFTILRLLGSGGMGEVYLVQHPRLPRRDALKILPIDASSDEDYRARFAREADLASQLWHPHIVAVHDRGEAESQLWISMDYVDGHDLGQLMAQRYPNGMPASEVTAVVTAVAGALDYAHKKDLLHRDVKPANIMLALDDDSNPRILLGEFGIARMMGDDRTGITTTNTTVGTVAYSAPEQLMGDPLDGRTDQYALAATAYRLLTGETLFPNTNPAVVISRHLNADPPPLSELRSELKALDPVLAAALSKNPDDRFARCADFAQAFAEQASTAATPSVAPTTPAPTRHPKSAGVTAPKTRPKPARAPQPPKNNRAFTISAIAMSAAALIAIVTMLLWRPWSDSRSTGAITTPQPPTTSSASPSQASSQLQALPPPQLSAAPADPYRYALVHDIFRRIWRRLPGQAGLLLITCVDLHA